MYIHEYLGELNESLKTALAVNLLHVIIKLNFTKCLHKVRHT